MNVIVHIYNIVLKILGFFFFTLERVLVYSWYTGPLYMSLS